MTQHTADNELAHPHPTSSPAPENPLSDPWRFFTDAIGVQASALTLWMFADLVYDLNIGIPVSLRASRYLVPDDLSPVLFICQTVGVIAGLAVTNPAHVRELFVQHVVIDAMLVVPVYLCHEVWVFIRKGLGVPPQSSAARRRLFSSSTWHLAVTTLGFASGFMSGVSWPSWHIAALDVDQAGEVDDVV